MRIPLRLVFLFLAVTSQVSFARLNELEENIEKRYGKSISDRDGITEDSKAKVYLRHDVFVTVQYVEGKSSAESFCKGEKGALEKAEIESLLDANRGESTWKLAAPQAGKTIWSRSDKGAIAIYDIFAKTLLVMNTDYYDKIVAKNQQTSKEKMRDF